MALPLLAIPFLGSMFTRFIPFKVWLILGFAAMIGLGLWRMNYLSKMVKSFKHAVEVEQNIVNGNRELVEDLSRADDEIMFYAQKRARQNGKSFMSWLFKQEPPTDGKMPPGYVKKMNEVR